MRGAVATIVAQFVISISQPRAAWLYRPPH